MKALGTLSLTMLPVLLLSACPDDSHPQGPEGEARVVDRGADDNAGGAGEDSGEGTEATDDVIRSEGADIEPATQEDEASAGDAMGAISDDTGVADTGNGGPADVEAQDPTQPSIPTACSGLNRGGCACNDAEGFTTWTWWVAEQQRCATTYIPPSAAGPLPVLISNDCYTANGLGQCQSGSEMVAAADRFGFIGLCTTSADGNWTFGNDGVINDEEPTPCSPQDSKDITYLDGVFGIIDQLGASGEAKADAVYPWGFSQNAMFTAWMSFCYPERITAFWQGGSGLFVAGVTNPLPQMEGVCRHSDYLEHGQECAEVTPCDACQYFPVYPVSTTPPMAGCVMAYKDDFLFETSTPMAEAMTSEGHDATLLHFPDIGRGHSNPLIHWDWLVGCMGVVDACSATCSAALVQCVEDMAGNSAQAREADYETCLDSGLTGCESGCAPTLDMLRLVERPCVVDGVCEKGETSQSCALDCGGDVSGGVEQLPSCDERGRPNACCGDMVCDGPETAENCVVDCAEGASGDVEQLPSCEERGRQNLCCGDMVCDGPENADNCVVDCT